ncbi:MAG: LLM class flavin-dependent oxidoreductase [Nitriliruptoraceae bacterium]
MKFGIQGAGAYPEGMPDGGFFRDVAIQVEEAGYDSLWVGEHVAFKNPLLDAVTTLGFFAAVTRRVQLGSGIILLPLKHPSLVAKQTTTIDHLSGGRFIFGIGVGGEGDKDFEAVGISKARRGLRTDEAVAAIRALWAGPNATHQGEFFQFEEITMEPRPVQLGGPPIWVGGKSERAVRRTAQLGDGWFPGFVSPNGYARGVAQLRQQTAQYGRDFDKITRAMAIHTFVDDDGEHAFNHAQSHLAKRYGMEFTDEQIRRIFLAGDPDYARSRIKEYEAAGMEHIVFIPVVGPDMFQQQVDYLSREVITKYE